MICLEIFEQCDFSFPFEIKKCKLLKIRVSVWKVKIKLNFEERDLYTFVFIVWVLYLLKTWLLIFM